jgi:ketopantoate hydroxymethyltransferase
MIKDFHLAPNNISHLIAKIQALDCISTQWVCNVRPRKTKRTLDQNSRLWKLYTALGNHIGLTPDEVHQLMGYKFLRYQKEVNGEVQEFVKSTTKLTTAEMSSYQEAIERLGAEWGFIFMEDA